MQENTDSVEVVWLGGHKFFVMPSGKVYPAISGAATDEGDNGDSDDQDQNDDSDESDDDDDSDNDDDDDEDDGDEPKTFNEDEVRRIASREKKDGRRSGRNAVLKELGFKTIDDAKKALRGSKKETDDDGSEQDDDDAAEDRQMAKVKGRAERSLIRHGLIDDSDKFLEGVLVMLDLESDFSEDDITTAVEDFKSTNPALFGGENGSKRKPMPNSDPGRQKKDRRQPSGRTGEDLFKTRHGK